MFDMLPVPVLLRDDSYSNNLTIKSRQSLTIPNEIILGILKIIQDFPDIYRSIPESTFSSKRSLLECACLNKTWAPIAIAILHRKFYLSKLTPRISNERLLALWKKENGEWERICMTALACINAPEWGLGSPRLFYIDNENLGEYYFKGDRSSRVSDSSVLAQASQKHPNPQDERWRTLLSCSLDIQDVYADISHSVQLDPVPGINPETGEENDPVPMMLRYSERMDLGCFLLFLNLDSCGPIIFRIKPIGEQMSSSCKGNGSLILWDQEVYGTCTNCQLTLPRVQVCADCRVAQYCSRKCQRIDWEKGHKNICKSLAFVIYNNGRNNEAGDEDDVALAIAAGNDELGVEGDVDVDATAEQDFASSGQSVLSP